MRRRRVQEPAARVLANRLGPALAASSQESFKDLVRGVLSDTPRPGTAPKERSRRSVSPSTGSSSETVGEPNTRTRTLTRRARHRLGRHLDDALVTWESGANFLIEAAVGKKSSVEYARLVSEFERAHKLGDLELVTATTLDNALATYFEGCFFRGIQSSTGAKILGGIMHRYPRYGKLGDARLPKAWRALRGWRKLTPGRSRRPEPLMLWCGLANALILDGKMGMAMFVMLSVSTYLRPSSLLALTRSFLVKPAKGCSDSWTILAHPRESGDPSKTGEFDLSLRLDSPWFRPLNGMLEVLKEGDADKKVFGFDYYQYAKSFKKAATLCRVKVVPYQTRHSGASLDRLYGWRSALEVKNRGDWKADTSVKRYEKSGRVQHSAARFDPAMDQYFRTCERQLADMFLRGRAVPLPA